MEKNVCIVNFNTPELTHAAILSLQKHTQDIKVTVFDNSDRVECFKMEGISVIDNTQGQIIDFNPFLDRFPNKRNSCNNWGSDKHCFTIDKLWDFFPEGFVLADSDILVKRDISSFFDSTVAFTGKTYSNPNKERKLVERVYPFLCWINVPMCRSAGVRYFSENCNWELSGAKNPYEWYDTGAFFLKDCRTHNLPEKIVDISQYIIHLGSASWKQDTSWQRWLELNKNLY